MYRVDAPHFCAGIDFRTKECAPILRFGLELGEEKFLQYVTKKGYNVIMIIKGQIESLKEFPGKFGSMWSMTVNGERYGLGKSNQGVSQGSWVEFEANKNARGYLDVVQGTLQPAKAPAGATASVGPTAQHVDRRQDSIVYQSSRKDALVFVQMMLEAGMIDFGKSKNAGKIQILEHYLDSYTEHFVQECQQGHSFASSEDDPSEAHTPAVDAVKAERFTDA